MVYYNVMEIIDKITKIILSIISIFGIIAGVYMSRNYISKTKERKNESVFNFYSRFHIFLLEFRNMLGSPFQSVLLLKYSADCLRGVEAIALPENSEIDTFASFVNRFIIFLEDTDNQIPLSESVLDNKFKLERVLVSLRSLGKKTPYNEYKSNEPVIGEHKCITSIVDTLIENIETDQSNLTIRIHKNKTKTIDRNILTTFYKLLKEKM